MPAEPFFTPCEVHTDSYAYFLAPSELPTETQEWIIRILGTSPNGLGITERVMRKNLQRQNLSAVVLIPGAAFGCLQYYDWLATGTPQMWATDLCRISPEFQQVLPGESKTPYIKPPESPIPRLLSILAELAKQDLWIMVEVEKLVEVYERYGFQTVGFHQQLKAFIMKIPKELRI
jgi:hypothetical protein